MNELELTPRPDVIPFIRKEEVREYGRTTTYAVHGFWVDDSVRITQSRSWRDLEKWEDPKISWSCGGREQGAEPDDIVAVECFGKAIADAVEVARKWRTEI